VTGSVGTQPVDAVVKAIVLRELARRDTDEVIDHTLSLAQTKVALGFVAALEQACTLIGRQPAAGSPRYAHALNLPGLRSWPLTRYPYLVFCVEHDDFIDVWRVLHQERDLPAWMMEA
jgi:toxin ParE1/3/4